MQKIQRKNVSDKKINDTRTQRVHELNINLII